MRHRPAPKVARTATLQVPPLDAQKLALAQEVGSLSLVLRKPGEQNNPVVETVSMNDLRYNMYSAARYPAPAVVGNFGTAVASSIKRSAATISTVHSASAAKHKAAPAATDDHPNVEVYRGTKSDKVKVGG